MRRSSPLLRALARLRPSNAASSASAAAEATPSSRPQLPPLASPPPPRFARTPLAAADDAWAPPPPLPLFVALRALSSSVSSSALPPPLGEGGEGDLVVEPDSVAAASAATATAAPASTTAKPRDMAIAFTCSKCDARCVKAFSRQAYERGVVIVQCPGCKARHLIADNLGWFPEGGVEKGAGARTSDEHGEPGGPVARRGGGGSWRVEDLAAEGRTDVRRVSLQQAVEEELAEVVAAAAGKEEDDAGAGRGRGG